MIFHDLERLTHQDVAMRSQTYWESFACVSSIRPGEIGALIVRLFGRNERDQDFVCRDSGVVRVKMQIETILKTIVFVVMEW